LKIEIDAKIAKNNIIVGILFLGFIEDLLTIIAIRINKTDRDIYNSNDGSMFIFLDFKYY